MAFRVKHTPVTAPTTYVYVLNHLILDRILYVRATYYSCNLCKWGPKTEVK